ncbi:MAG: ATP--guanido phosphotransferase [Clostridia bacterium]|nr:ATP--guanido phosphotransferase [Clostridia bacterium]
MKTRRLYECVAVSSRVRLARNFADYPFPGRLLRDRHAEEQAEEIVQLVGAQLATLADFIKYDMRTTSEETAALLVERNLISRDLLKHRAISAAFVHRDENISVMVNEEDHIREQYFTKGFELQRAYDSVRGIDDAISESLLFAYDERLGYLTACPTNLGTGLRASVMLFLPALSRLGILKEIVPDLVRQGLTVRGSLGEGSGGEGDLFQISTEFTLCKSEEEILGVVEGQVDHLVEFEIRERPRLRKEGGVKLKDKIMRAYGVLTNSCRMEKEEFAALIAEVKLGVVLGYFGGDGSEDERVEELDDLAVEMRPAGIMQLYGAPLSAEEQNEFRAECTAKKIRKMDLIR